MIRTFEMTDWEYWEASEDNQGKCMACTADAFNVEPDARKYTCESCGRNTVYGLQELMIMGRIEISEE